MHKIIYLYIFLSCCMETMIFEMRAEKVRKTTKDIMYDGR